MNKPKVSTPASSSELVRRLDSLLLAGQMCSNVCYNLAQGRSISNDDQRSMREAYERWDKESHEVRSLMLPTEKGKP